MDNKVKQYIQRDKLEEFYCLTTDTNHMKEIFAHSSVKMCQVLQILIKLPQ